MIAPASLYSVRDAADDLMVARDAPFKTAKDLIGERSPFRRSMISASSARRHGSNTTASRPHRYVSSS